jgi:hypothetical protein
MCQTCITTNKCVHCEADLAIKLHRLTALHVECLFKLRAAVRHYGRNSIHLRDDMRATGCPFRLSDDQWTNFGKLRYFGLAHHADRENPRSGSWLLTDRGAAFLQGKITIPRKVFTFRGHPVDSPEPVKPVHILEYRKELPSFETYYDFTPAVSGPAKTAQLFS